MKKHNKLTRSISLMLCCLMLIGSITSVYAASKEYKLKWVQLGSTYNKTYTFTGDSSSQTNCIDKFTLDGDTAFCLECGRKITGYDNVPEGTTNVTRVQDVKDSSSKAAKVAYLGWSTSSKSNKAYAFTQMYLWELHTDMEWSGNKNVKFANSDTKAAYKEWKADIDAEIATWNTKPSFNNDKLSIKSGESKTVTDSNSVLKYYEDFNYTKGGVTVKHTKGSNKMTYSAAAGTASKTVSMTKDNLEDAGAWKYPSKAKANYIYDADGEQILSTWGAVDPVSLAVAFDVSTPTVGTTAIDGETKTHQSGADSSVTIVDTVSYTNVIVGSSYTVTGTLMDKETGKAITVNGKTITSSATFTPTETSGTVNVTFKFDGTSLAGKTTVVFEDLYLNNTKVATHSDISDVDQTIYFPNVGTTAVDSETKDHVSSPDEEVTIIDTVKYTNLIKGKEYTVTGTLMDKDTGEPLLVNNEKVTATKTFTPENTDGSVELTFTFDGSALAGKTVVAFEDIYLDKVNVGTHSDINDKEQSVYFPEIGTTAVDSDTKDHVSSPDEEVTIVDTVKYENLVAGLEYTLSGTLMDKDTGEPLLVNGEKVTATTTFTPEATSGTVDVTFTFDGSGLENKTLVAFESLTHKDVEVAIHDEIDEAQQSVYFPEIGTTAIDSETGEQVSYADEDVTIVDTVSYKNLIAGKEYTVTGTLMDKETGEPLLVNNEKVIATTTFIPENTEGTVDVTFTFDGSALAGKTVVAFEDVYYSDTKIATHTDIEDTEQSVYFPEIGTTAVDSETKDHTSYADDDVTIIDTVKYENLVVGKEYTISGILMDKATGEEIKVDGKNVTATTTFTPKAAAGTVDVTFKFDGSKLIDKELVAFETVSINDYTVATHTDIDDAGQTVKMKEVIGVITMDDNISLGALFDIAETGDLNNILPYIAVLLIALIGFIAAYRYKRKGGKEIDDGEKNKNNF